MLNKRGYTPEERGICRIVGTPVGNLGDMTPRAIEALEQADIVFAEDTRTARALLHHFNISKNIQSYHKDNEAKACKDMLECMENGKKTVLISEAGMPGVSDPGFLLIRELMQRQLPFEVVPGVSAGVTAAVASGLCRDGRYIFCGFLPQKTAREALNKYAGFGLPVVIYESPNRVKNTLEMMFEFFSAPIAVCRELTKLHEEVFWVHSPLDIENILPKGEFCLVASGVEINDVPDCDNISLKADELAGILLDGGLTFKDAVDILKKCGVKRNTAYGLVQNLQK